MLTIITAPNPILSQTAKEVSKLDKNILKFIEEMKQSLESAKDPIGVGLAAPQVGKSVRIFIAKPSDKSKVLIFINPKILTKSSEKDYVKRPKKDASEKASKKLEGCLSLPNIWGPVLRSSSLILFYLDQNGNTHKEKFSGFLSTIIQHELDHLNGILFPK